VVVVHGDKQAGHQLAISAAEKGVRLMWSELVLCDDWHGNTGCLVAQDLALLTKVRTLIHEEISLLTMLYFPFRARTPKGLQKDPLS
jgi:hypothetical protein